MQKGWRRGLMVSLSLSAMAALIVVLLTFEPETIENLGLVEPRFLVLAFIMLLITIGIEGARIRAIGIAMGGHMSWFHGCVTFLGTSFASLITPMGIGEFPALTYFYNQSGLNLGAAAAASIVRGFVTKLVFLAGIIWLFGFARGRVQFGPVTGDIFTLVAIVFALGTMVNACYVIFPNLLRRLFSLVPKRWQGGKLGRWQRRLEQETHEFDRGLKILWRRGPGVLLWVGLLSLGYWTLWFGLLPVLARGLGVVVEPASLVGRQLVLLLALPFIPIPGGSGAMELAMAAMYQGIFPRALIGVFILSWRLLTYWVILLLGALSAFGRLWNGDKGRKHA